MSRQRFNQVAAPSAPASSKGEVFFDSTSKRMRFIDEKGQKSDISGGLDSLKILVNAGFKYAQRQTPGTLTSYAATTGRSYAADRWGMTIQTSSLQYARVDTIAAPETGLQARFYGQFKQITGAGKFVVSQVIEASRAFHLRGKQVRLMASLKASSAKTIRLGLMQLNSAGTVDTIPVPFESAFGADTVDPTWGANLALIAPDLLPLACFGAAPGTQAVRNSGLDCSVTTSWQTFGGLFTLPSNLKNLIVVIWTDAQFSINDILNVSQVTVLNQSQDCDWNEMPDEQDLEACQRYFEKSCDVDSALVATALGINTGETVGLAGKAGAVANAGIIWCPFRVPKRATAPTVTLFNPVTNSSAQVRDEVANVDHTATSAVNTTQNGFSLTSTGNASTAVGDRIGIHWTAEKEL